MALTLRGVESMPDVQADLSIRKEGTVTLVELRDRKILDESQIQEIGERLSELVQAEPAPSLLLDFGAVEYLSSAALSVLITLKHQIVEQQGRLVLAGIHPQIYEVFKITRLDRLFDIQATTEEGFKSIQLT